jgi:hypothetical protein
MKSTLPARLLGLVFLGGVVSSAATARADEPPGAPPAAPDYEKQPVEGPQYTAPLYQKTQPSYVPQSVALSGPREIKGWTQGDPVPPGYRTVERTRKGLVIGGAVLFGTTYLVTALAGAIADDYNSSCGGLFERSCSTPRPNVTALYVPAIGPFIQIANTRSATTNTALAIDGLAQSAGAVMLIVGLTSPKTVLVRNDLAEIRVTPMVGRGTTGAALTGTF